MTFARHLSSHTPRSHALALVLSLLALALGSAAVQAAGPDLLAGPGLSLASSDLDPTELARAEKPVHDFARATGSRWSVLDWAPSSLTPRLAYGTGLDLGTPITNALDAETQARAFVDAHPELFGTRSERLVLFRAHPGLGKWSLIFHEQIGGQVVLNSQVTVLLTDAGRLAAFGAATYPMIESVESPRISETEAVASAYQHLRAQGLVQDDLARIERRRVIGSFVLPVALRDGSAPAGSAGIVGRPVERVVIGSPAGQYAYQLDVDAVSGAVLERRDIARALDYVGSVQASVEEPGYCNGAAPKSFPGFFVTIDGLGTVTTDANGNFTLPYAGTDPRTITAEMKGELCDVENVAGAQAAFSGTITPGVPFVVNWNSGNAREDEMDTWYHVNVTHAALRAIDPNWHDLDFPLPANVNVQSSCNAIWDGEAINMYHEAGGCANTGRIGDVISHEYGHGITDYMYGPNDPGGDLHEGNSDITGTFRNNNPIVGPGFYLGDCVNGIRNLDNDLRWPEDLGGEGHHDGQIIGGVLWDTRAALVASLGYAAGSTRALEIWHFSRILGLPHTQPEQVLWSFLADDDNGNLDDGTPSYDALCPAAEHHGFTCPERFDDVVIHHVPLVFGEGPDLAPIAVDAELYSLSGALDLPNCKAFARPLGGGSFVASPFIHLSGDDYRAQVAGQNVGAYIEYYVEAKDVLGHVLRRPATGTYIFQVVTNYEPFEADAGGWTVGAAGDNAVTGVWERVDPVGTTLAGLPLQPDDDTTPDPGALCWITEQYEGGQPYQSDADGITTLLSPIYNLTGMTWASVRYDRWFQTLSSAAGVLEISVSHNGGSSWILLERVQGSQNPNDWRTNTRVITPQLGPLGLTRFRVVMKGQPLPSVDEAGFDGFVLLADDQGGPAAVGDETRLANAASIRLVSENPSSGLCQLEYRNPVAGPVSLSIYQVDGRQVRTLFRAENGAGQFTASWDGLDERGAPVATGVYFARLSTRAGSDVRRIVIAR